MKSRIGWVLCLWMASSSTAIAAGPTTAPPRAAKVAPATVAKVAAPATKPPVAKTTVAKATATKTTAAKAKPAANAKGNEAPRTLQDIHIEGEIPVPQVLFITARDQRRFLDFQHRRYLRTSQQVGEQTVLPSWIGVTGNHPTETRKENPQ